MPAASVDAPHTATLDVQKSRFIGWCAAVDGIDDAQRLVALARRHHPEASHHCFAYIAGAPDDDQAIGWSRSERRRMGEQLLAAIPPEFVARAAGAIIQGRTPAP